MKINLSDQLWTKAVEVGRKRQELEQEGIWTKGWSGRTIETEAVGVMGELIICNLFNYKPEFVYGKQDNQDLLIFNKTVDVKTSLQKNGFPIMSYDMLVHKYQKPKQLYIFVIISEDKRYALVRGWCDRATVDKYSTIWIYQNCELLKLSNQFLYDIELILPKENKGREDLDGWM